MLVKERDILLHLEYSRDAVKNAESIVLKFSIVLPCMGMRMDLKILHIKRRKPTFNQQVSQYSVKLSS